MELPLDRVPWMRDAVCRQHPNPDLWFPTRGRNDLAQAAKAVCATCPVQRACLVYAVLRNEAIGVWGSSTPTQRVAIRRVLASRGHDLKEARALSESAACAAS